MFRLAGFCVWVAPPCMGAWSWREGVSVGGVTASLLLMPRCKDECRRVLGWGVQGLPYQTLSIFKCCLPVMIVAFFRIDECLQWRGLVCWCQAQQVLHLCWDGSNFGCRAGKSITGYGIIISPIFPCGLVTLSAWVGKLVSLEDSVFFFFMNISVKLSNNHKTQFQWGSLNSSSGLYHWIHLSVSLVLMYKFLFIG